MRRATISGCFSLPTHSSRRPDSAADDHGSHCDRRNGSKWKVYDAVVENISIVNNYRSQFDRVNSKSSNDELKKMLNEKAG